MLPKLTFPSRARKRAFLTWGSYVPWLLSMMKRSYVLPKGERSHPDIFTEAIDIT